MNIETICKPKLLLTVDGPAYKYFDKRTSYQFDPHIFVAQFDDDQYPLIGHTDGEIIVVGFTYKFEIYEYDESKIIKATGNQLTIGGK